MALTWTKVIYWTTKSSRRPFGDSAMMMVYACIFFKTHKQMFRPFKMGIWWYHEKVKNKKQENTKKRLLLISTTSPSHHHLLLLLAQHHKAAAACLASLYSQVYTEEETRKRNGEDECFVFLA